MRKKYGFTLVELLVVIGIIAVLSVVGIIGYVSFTDRARLSRDISSVTEINTVNRDSMINKKRTMQQTLEHIEEFNINIDNLTNTQINRNIIVWDSVNDEFLILDKRIQHQNEDYFYNCVYPDTNKTVSVKDAYKYFAIYNEVPSGDQHFSIYLTGEEVIETPIDVSVGFDVGNNTAKTIKYKHNGIEDSDVSRAGVILRTNKGTLEYTSDSDELFHYGEATEVNIIECADHSYHECGGVHSLDIKKGHVVVENGSIIGNLTNDDQQGQISIDLNSGSYCGNLMVNGGEGESNSVSLTAQPGANTVNLLCNEEKNVTINWIPGAIVKNSNLTDKEDGEKNIHISGLDVVEIVNTELEDPVSAPNLQVPSHIKQLRRCDHKHILCVGDFSIRICEDCGMHFFDTIATDALNEGIEEDVYASQYSIDFTDDTMAVGETIDVVNTKHEHEYNDEPECDWAEDYNSVKAIFTCSEENCNHTFTIVCTSDTDYVSSIDDEVTTKPTLEHTGVMKRTVTCQYPYNKESTVDNFVELVLPHLNNEAYDCQVIKDPTCENAGEDKYSIEFYGKELEFSVTTNPKRHNYQFDSFIWDGYNAQALYVCANDQNHTEKHNATVDDTVTTEPTCEATGVRTYTATYDDYRETKDETISALGHSYGGPVWNWNDDYTSATATFTCEHNSEHTVQRTDSQLDEEILETGETRYTAIVNFNNKDYSDSRVVAPFEHKFVNHDKYLYRVGNGNDILLSSIFKPRDGFTPDYNKIAVNLELINGNVELSETKTTWNNYKIKFSNTGVIRLKLSYNEIEVLAINLEVIDAMNATGPTNAESNSVVLLNDVVKASSITISNGYTFYGNGFTLYYSGDGSQGDNNESNFATAFVNLNNGSLDNVQVKCSLYSNSYGFVSGNYGSQQTNGSYLNIMPAVATKGNSYITNSYIYGARANIFSNDGNLTIKNTVCECGATANIQLWSKNYYTLTLEDVTTIQYNNNGVYGVSILNGNDTDNSSAKIIINNCLNIYNWVCSSDASSVNNTYVKQAIQEAVKVNEYKHRYNNKDYVNVGIVYLNGDETDITDTRSVKSDYKFSSLDFNGYSGGVYSIKSDCGSVEFKDSSYEFIPNKQNEIEPNAEFDFTGEQFFDGTDNSENYCYYQSSSDTVLVSFKKTTESDKFEFDPRILNVEKYGEIINYFIKMNSIDYTNVKINFLESGEYSIIYSYTDSNNYDYKMDEYSKTYEKILNLNVTIIEPDSKIYHPEFTYASSWDTYNAKQLNIGTETYISIDANNTSSTIGSTTVSGQTIYYPIVTVDGKNSSGGKYENGKIYCFAPAFSAINIKDLNKDTGAELYTYNSSSQNWPHNISATTGPGASLYYGPASTRDPYGAATGATYEKYAYNATNGGLCYTSNEIEKRDITENNKLVKFHYVGNDGITYYYYIKYHYTLVTYVASEWCFTGDTLITLVDGTKIEIKSITNEDSVLSYNFFTGELEGNKVCFIANHGLNYYTVIKLLFDDETELNVIGEHGVFDYDLNRFVYISNETINKYINHSFYKEDGSLIKLVDYHVTEEFTNAYSITSSYDMNTFANGVLTTPPPEDFYNWIEMDSTTKMRFDLEIFMEDVNKYGLLDYSYFEDYVPYEIYDSFNGKYLGIPIAKGLFTKEELFEIIEMYSIFWE